MFNLQIKVVSCTPSLKQQAEREALLEHSCTVDVCLHVGGVSCAGAVWARKHVWPPLRSKWPLAWQSAPGPQAAAGNVCPSRETPGGGGRRRGQGKTRTRGGPAGGRWRLERLGRGEGTLAVSGCEVRIYVLRRVASTHTHLCHRQSPLWRSAFSGIWELERSWRDRHVRSPSFIQEDNFCNELQQPSWARCFQTVPFRPRPVVTLLTGSARWLGLSVTC